MSETAKKMIVGSMIIAALICLVAIADMAIAMPFGGQFVLDTTLLISALIVLYMGYSSYRELR